MIHLKLIKQQIKLKERIKHIKRVRAEINKIGKYAIEKIKKAKLDS